MLETFDIDTTPIEDVAKCLGSIYQDVKFTGLPIFRWLHVLNDATILAEDVRRNRFNEGIERAGKILMRILEFIGYYLYIFDVPHSWEKLGSLKLPGLVAYVFQTHSYDYFGKSKLIEGPTRWILAKYPYACSKCGEKPCHCVISPWIFEERREKPGPFAEYLDRTHSCKEDL